MKTETKYLLRRASEEAHRALSAQVPEAANAHETMSVHYSARALIMLMEDDQALEPCD